MLPVFFFEQSGWRRRTALLQNGVADLLASLDFRNRGFNLVVLGL